MTGFTKIHRVKSRTVHPVLMLIMFTAFVCQVHAQQDDRRVETIRRLATQVNKQIEESERVEESNGVYCNELVVNKGDKSWPAVGIYRTIVKFYYTFGDREKNPYPNRLMKITVATNRSARHEQNEYLFDSAGQLIFYYEKVSDDSAAEQRYYFASGKLIRVMKGQRTVAVNSRNAIETVKGVLSKERKLSAIFLKSLEN